MTIRRIAHVCVVTTDLAATERFYCIGLGGRKVFDFVRAGRAIGFYLEVAEQTYIEVFHDESARGEGKDPLRHLCLEVSGMDTVIARLRSMGYTVSDKVMGDDHAWQCWTSDPNGVGIEFQEYTDTSCQKTGDDCILH